MIGCGNIAHHYVDVIQSLGHKLIGVASRPGSRKIASFSSKHNTEGYEDFHDMIVSTKPDAIIICVAWHAMEAVITQTLQYKLPVLAEKPVALSIGGIKRITSNRFYHNNVMVAYNRRFYDFIPKLQAAIREKKLLSVFLNLPETLSKYKTLDPNIAESILLYSSSHVFDLLTHLLGQIKPLNVVKHTSGYNGFLTSCDGSVPIHYQSNFDTPQQTTIGFSFTDEYWELRPLETLTVYNTLELTQTNPIKKYQMKMLSQWHTNYRFKPGFAKQMACFIKFCDQDKSLRSMCDMHDASLVTMLCEQIQNSEAVSSLTEH